MIIEVILLALASTVRPTSLAAVYAILSHESARRLMLAFVVVGLCFTVGFGVLVVGAFHGIHVSSASDDHTRGILDLLSGVVLVGFGIVALTRHTPTRRSREAPEPSHGWRAGLERRLTPVTAAVAGPLTHIPGIFYLVALNVIVAHHLWAPAAFGAVVVYNAIWFAVPIAALIACIVRPATARDLIEGIQQWARAHSGTIVVATAFVAGIALVIRGLLEL